MASSEAAAPAAGAGHAATDGPDPLTEALHPAARLATRARVREFRWLLPQEMRLDDDFAIRPGLLGAVRFAAGQWLLGGGGGGARAVRAWYRRVRWAQLRRQHGTWGALRWVCAQPFRVARTARSFVQHRGAALRALSGVSPTAQFAQLCWLRLVHGIDETSYCWFGLYRPEQRRRATRFLQAREARVVFRLLAFRDAPADYLVCVDKRRFEEWARQHALPSARVLLELVHERIVPDADPAGVVAMLRQARGRDLFSKPTDGSQGRGAYRWRAVGEGWVHPDGTTRDAAALLDGLRRWSQRGGVLLQACLDNHPALHPIAGRALSTVRLMTARPPGGPPEAIMAAYRTGIGEASADNMSAGGIGAAIDLATGRLGRAVRVDPLTKLAPVARHPDSGVPFAGIELPWWREAVALGLRAHAHLPAITVVGWDIALTPDGPVLIEGNPFPAARIAQGPSGDPLGETPMLRYLDAHLRRSYAWPPRP